MKTRIIVQRLAAILLSLLISSLASGQAGSIPTSGWINPEDLLKALKSGREKPLILQVGSHILFAQAHIVGSEYVGAASTEAGLNQLRKRVESVARTKFIVLYCGCCPWSHCPNVKPAHDALTAMGFTNLKVLYLSDNFGKNWVDKGYPVAKGE